MKYSRVSLRVGCWTVIGCSTLIGCSNVLGFSDLTGTAGEDDVGNDDPTLVDATDTEDRGDDDGSRPDVPDEDAADAEQEDDAGPEDDAAPDAEDAEADAEPDPEDATIDAPEDVTDAAEDATVDAAPDAANEVPVAPDWTWAAAVPVEWMVTTFAGSGTAGFTDGTGTSAMFNYPSGMAMDGSGNLYVADAGNNRIRKVSPTGNVTTMAGSGTAGFADGTAASARFYFPYGIDVDGNGNVYVADCYNYRIRKVSPTGTVTTLAGSGTSGFLNGTSTKAKFDNPLDVAVDGSGNVYVADANNNRIRKVDFAGNVTTFTGAGPAGFADGKNTAAKFQYPSGVNVDGSGNVYVADANNNRIRRVDPAGNVITLAGSGTAGFADGKSDIALFSAPRGVAVDGSGNLFVADSNNNRIRKVSVAGVVTTLAGSGTKGFADGKAASAKFDTLRDVTIAPNGSAYIADYYNHRIRKVELSGVGKLAVSWNASPPPNGPPVLGYTASASANGQPTRACSTTSATTCVISGLTSGIPYAVSVVATNAAGNSAPSSPVLGTPN